MQRRVVPHDDVTVAGEPDVELHPGSPGREGREEARVGVLRRDGSRVPVTLDVDDATSPWPTAHPLSHAAMQRLP